MNEDEQLIDDFLNDKGFQEIVEKDIGRLVAPVRVDWEKNKISFFGERQARELMIDATLATLKKQIN